MKAAADTNLKRVSLELGGKSPLVSFFLIIFRLAGKNKSIGYVR
jgi:acyl-CoA reductase-like NAD-dependent aldehyde dehydrogenase